jgi:hypothetical protein
MVDKGPTALFSTSPRLFAKKVLRPHRPVVNADVVDQASEVGPELAGSD